ncbi:MAG: hypothetical protein GDA43_22500 [Hormoscilla sp. SP5CHS1]|nr:hypothetical protein [Hormoscilla sp. SP12CHS1]MBC6455613.1 hypothetical protein [Hormoscilla sp. SP5CHS1]
MKLELERIEATLAQIIAEQNNNVKRSAIQKNQTYSFDLLPKTPPEIKATIPPIQPLSQENRSKTPALPKLKTSRLSSHQNAANLDLAINLLQEIQGVVAGWQRDLQQVHAEIQDLYGEGPIVDGWLESNPPGGGQQDESAGYRLCRLESNGKLWFCPCPPDQVATVSVAISRYHQLRQLLGRKQDMESRLTQLSEALIILHGQLREA